MASCSPEAAQAYLARRYGAAGDIQTKAVDVVIEPIGLQVDGTVVDGQLQVVVIAGEPDVNLVIVRRGPPVLGVGKHHRFHPSRHLEETDGFTAGGIPEEFDPVGVAAGDIPAQVYGKTAFNSRGGQVLHLDAYAIVLARRTLSHRFFPGLRGITLPVNASRSRPGAAHRLP
jgi:hypothetical protein